MAASGLSHWEELRRSARQVENEIEAKLTAFGKLGAGFRQSSRRGEGPESTMGADHTFETMSRELGELLSKLTAVNNKLCDVAAEDMGHSASVSHTVDRHRNILDDYEQEFRKTKTMIGEMRARQDLLASQSGSPASMRRPANANDYYLSENQRIHSSHRITDESIGAAVATKEGLVQQRAMFNSVNSRVTGLFSRFPAINSLVQRINVRKHRDSLILGSVIAVCLIILFLYRLY